MQSRSGRWLTPLGIRVFSAGLVLGGLAVLTAGRWLLVAGCFLVFLPWVSLIALPSGRLDLLVDAPRRARIGGAVAMQVTLVNNGRRRLSPLHAVCTRPGFAPAAAVLTSIGAGGSTAWELRDEPVARAVVRRVTLEVLLGDAFGLCRRRVVLFGTTELLIGPRAVPARSLPDVAGSGDEDEMAGLRQWRPGERMSAIAWRASARRGTGPGSALLAQEGKPREPAELRVGLVGGAGPAGERALEVLTAVACIALAEGRAVTVLLGPRAERVGRPEQLIDLFAPLPALPDRLPDSCDVLVSGGGSVIPGRTLLVEAEGQVMRR